MTKKQLIRADQSLPFHEAAGVWVNPKSGEVFNRHGRKIGSTHGHRYARVNKHGRIYYVHRLVYEAVHGEIPDGMVVNHKSGDKADNRISNLEMLTPGENVRHAAETGLSPKGERCSWSKLTDADAIAILKTRDTVTTAEWAKRLGVSRAAVAQARAGHSWRHVAYWQKIVRGEAA